MIFVVQDDTTMRVIESVEEANLLYESVDVESGSYTFLDAHGNFLRPVMRHPSKEKKLSFECSPFTLEPTKERRANLIAQLQSGEFTIDARSAGVRSLADLKIVAPGLFSL